MGKQINKRDRLGTNQKIESICLDILALAIEAAYSTKVEKLPLLKLIRIKIEILKQLVRLTKDIQIITESRYIVLEDRLIEISKMNNNWLNWAMGKENPKLGFSHHRKLRSEDADCHSDYRDCTC